MQRVLISILMVAAGSNTSIELPYRFTPRDYQIPFLRAMDRGCQRACLVWHRRAGKDKSAVQVSIKKSSQRKGGYYYYFPTGALGRKILWEGQDNDGFRFIDHFPPGSIVRKNDTEMLIETVWGSHFRIIGTDNLDVVGTNPVGCVFSEYALQDQKAWGLIQPILRGNDGWAIFAYTPRGRNHGYDLYQIASVNRREWFCQLLTIDDTKVISRAAVEADVAAGMISAALAQQEYWCFPGSSRVATSRGYVPIQDIRPGEIVLTHTGRWRRVDAVSVREYSGPLQAIKTSGNFAALRCTPNHPIRVCNPSDQTYAWKEAQEVVPGDYAVMPRLGESLKILSRDWVRLLAWYVTEGSVCRTAAQFTLGCKEQSVADWIVSFLASEGVGATPRAAKSTINVQARSARLADWFVRSCGSGSWNKRIPWDFISGWEAEFFDELMLGEGCRVSESRWAYATVSPSLAYDVQMLAGMLGYAAGIVSYPAKECSIEGRVVQCREKYNVQISKGTSTNRIRPSRHGVAVLVRSVETEDFTGDVYNLSVSGDHSYVVEGRVVHNCDFNLGQEGSYYGALLQQAEREGRAGQYPYEPTLPVYAFSDLGNMYTYSLWVQFVRDWIRLVGEYWDNQGNGATAMTRAMQAQPWTWGKEHYAGPDMERSNAKSFHTGMTTRDTLASLGFHFRSVDPHRVEDGIEAGRTMWPLLQIDRLSCPIFLQAANGYRAAVNRQLTTDAMPVYRDSEVDSWECHPMDAYRHLAMQYKYGRIGGQYLGDSRTVAAYHSTPQPAQKRDIFGRNRFYKGRRA